MDNSKKITSFHLREESTGFSSRISDIFGSLDKIEKKHDQKQKELDKKPEYKREQQCIWKEDPKEEMVSSKRSPFKMPYSRVPSYRGSKFRRVGNKTPDYKVNPQNWTRYSLEDVPTNESSNTSAAFSFLEERRKLREAEERREHPENEDSDGKFVFKKPHKVSTGFNRFSSKKPKSSKSDKINMNHLRADDDVDNTDDKKPSDGEAEGQICEQTTSTTCDDKIVGFKKMSRKRHIRTRDDNASDEETEDKQ